MTDGIAKHSVKVNGLWYRAGESLPSEGPVKDEPKVDTVAEVAQEEVKPVKKRRSRKATEK